MERNDRSIWEKDFTEFLQAEPAHVPDPISLRIIEQIHSELHPSAFKVFGKILSIQFVVSLITLLFCPQFGISFTASHGIMPYLMKFGDSVCMLGCGAFFTALSLFVVSFALKPEEVRVLKEHEVLQLVGLATLSIAAFLCVGGEVIFTLALVWMLGSVIGGAITLETGWALRKSIARRAAN